MEPAALVPVKSFGAAKARLAPSLSSADRERLARWLATRVVAALDSVPVFIACDDEHVAAWAEDLGAEALWGPGLGLNGAIDHGVETLAGKGFDHVVIAHGDLPRPEALVDVLATGTIVIVPDRHRDGTNVLARPTAAEMTSQYGAGSFRAHLDAALRSGWPVQVRRDPLLSLDIDTVDDCRHPVADRALAPFLGEALRR